MGKGVGLSHIIITSKQSLQPVWFLLHDQPGLITDVLLLSDWFCMTTLTWCLTCCSYLAVVKWPTCLDAWCAAFIWLLLHNHPGLATDMLLLSDSCCMTTLTWRLMCSLAWLLFHENHALEPHVLLLSVRCFMTMVVRLGAWWAAFVWLKVHDHRASEIDVLLLSYSCVMTSQT